MFIVIFFIYFILILNYLLLYVIFEEHNIVKRGSVLAKFLLIPGMGIVFLFYIILAEIVSYAFKKAP